MRKEFYLNIEKNLIMKLLRHHTTLEMIYIINIKLISEGTKNSCTGKKSKYLGTGPFLIQNLTRAHGQKEPFLNATLKIFHLIGYIEIIIHMRKNNLRILMDYTMTSKLLNIDYLKNIRVENLKNIFKKDTFLTTIMNVFGQMRKIQQSNIRQILLTKLLRYCMTIETAYIRNELLISVDTQKSYNSEKSKIMGTGYFIAIFEFLRSGMAQ